VINLIIEFHSFSGEFEIAGEKSGKDREKPEIIPKPAGFPENFL
jgi:hypothetical protein